MSLHSKDRREAIHVSSEDAEAIKEALINAPDEGIVRLPESPSPSEPHTGPVAEQAPKPA